MKACNPQNRLCQGKERKENAGNEFTFPIWIIMVSLDVTFPQVSFTFITFRELCCYIATAMGEWVNE